MKFQAPCKDCELRSATCHESCERYKEWRKEWDEYKEKEFQERKKAGIHKAHIVAMQEKYRRKNGGKSR